jgi:two-component system OmpR family response regulator
MPGTKHTILVVDDESAIRRLLRRCFESENYTVLEAENGAQTQEKLNTQQVSLITLDVNLAGEDGLAIAREIRSRLSVPIIMVSGKGELIDTVLGLEVGADDYITKPFQLREVLARVKSALRRAQLNNAPSTPAPSRHNPSSALQFEFDGYTLCSSTRDIKSAEGTLGDLTTAEYDLLETFIRHAHHALSRDQIMDHMKGHDWNPNDRTIDNQVARLRRKLKCMGIVNPIKTVRGIGYQFTLNVESKPPSN